jgi:hypothetical protein
MDSQRTTAKRCGLQRLKRTTIVSINETTFEEEHLCQHSCQHSCENMRNRISIWLQGGWHEVGGIFHDRNTKLWHSSSPFADACVVPASFAASLSSYKRGPARIFCCISLNPCRHSKMLGGAPRLSSRTERIARLWNLPPRSTTAHAVQALQDSTARPICTGGLAHYFVQELQRRAQLEESPPLAPASAIAALAALPASQQECGALEEGCPVCLQTEAGGDGTRTIMLPCGHKFHKTCESSTKVCANPAERLEEKGQIWVGG